jgi:hypothetical protein
MGIYFLHVTGLERFEMWCWRRMEKISWTDHVRNEEVLLRGKEQRNILHEINKRKTNWVGHLCRNCLLQQVVEGKIKGGIEVKGRRGRRCRKLLCDLMEGRGYCHLQDEDLDRTMWRAGVGRGFGSHYVESWIWKRLWIALCGELDLEEALDRTMWRAGVGRGFGSHYVESWSWKRLWTCRETRLLNE